ncbi:MAG: MFS transporter [Thermoleophilia bacterium]
MSPSTPESAVPDLSPVAPLLPPTTGGSTVMPGPRQPLWTRDFALLLVSQVLYFVGVYLLLPTFPLFVVGLGGGEASAGLVLGFFTFAAMLVRPVTGWALDTYGRRAFLFIGLALTLFAIVAHEWVAGIGVLLALRLLHGVGFGFETTAGGTLASDLAPKARLGEAMGYFTLAMGLPMGVAPAIGLALTEDGDFTILFLLAAGLTGAALLLAGLIRVPQVERGGGRLSVRTLFERSSLLPATAVFLLTMTYAPILAFIALYGEERGISNVGPFFALFAVVLAVVRPLSGRLADRWGYLRTATLGLAFVAAGLAILALAGNLFFILAAAVLYGAGYGTSQPSLQALTVYGVAPARRGAAMAAFFFAYDLGIAVGSIGGGFLASWVSLSGVYWVALVPAAIAVTLQVGHLRKRAATVAV